MRSNLILLTDSDSNEPILMHVNEIRFAVQADDGATQLMTQTGLMKVGEPIFAIWGQFVGGIVPEFVPELCDGCKAAEAAQSVAIKAEAKPIAGPTLADFLAKNLSVRAENIFETTLPPFDRERDPKTVSIASVMHHTADYWAALKNSTPECGQQIYHALQEIQTGKGWN